mmetsp:Transcript_29206/g.60844  ORF Transcript_29206/g.60844 Transcript_29206/m.60844 type:complete len:97 (-) Transcript_29206:236-526(-)
MNEQLQPRRMKAEAENSLFHPPASLIHDNDDDNGDHDDYGIGDEAAMTSHKNAFTPHAMKTMASTISPGSEEIHRRVIHDGLQQRKSGRQHQKGRQ